MKTWSKSSNEYLKYVLRLKKKKKKNLAMFCY